MRGLVLLAKNAFSNTNDTRHQAASNTEAPRQMSLEEWKAGCRNVRTAAEQLRKLAGQAEGAAYVSQLSAETAPLLGEAVRSPEANMHFTMMLGSFAVLEGLREQMCP